MTTSGDDKSEAFIPSGGALDELASSEAEGCKASEDNPKKGISRRKFLKRAGALAALAVGAGAVDTFIIEPQWFEITNTTVYLPELPPAWQGARIAHITDMHIGRNSDLDDARRIVDMCNDQKPDIIALTGDYVSRADAITSSLVEVLRDLRAKDDIFAVLGNHDHWTNAHRVRESFAAAGIPLLVNQHRILKRKGQPLCIGGVDDLSASNSDAAEAFAGVDAKTTRVLLCHNPDYAEMIPRDLRVDLMLCGHTHGGQFRLPFIGPLIVPIKHRKYAEGLVAGPSCQVFISRGLGMVTIPGRFNCRPELPIITLKRA